MDIDGKRMAPPEGSVWETVSQGDNLFVVDGRIVNSSLDGELVSVLVGGVVRHGISPSWLRSVYNPIFLCVDTDVNVPLQFQYYFERDGVGYVKCYAESPTRTSSFALYSDEHDNTLVIPSSIEVSKVICGGAIVLMRQEIETTPPTNEDIEIDLKRARHSIIAHILEKIRSGVPVRKFTYLYPGSYADILDKSGISVLVNHIEGMGFKCETELDTTSRGRILDIKLYGFDWCSPETYLTDKEKAKTKPSKRSNKTWADRIYDWVHSI